MIHVTLMSGADEVDTCEVDELTFTALDKLLDGKQSHEHREMQQLVMDEPALFVDLVEKTCSLQPVYAEPGVPTYRGRPIIQSGIRSSR